MIYVVEYEIIRKRKDSFFSLIRNYLIQHYCVEYYAFFYLFETTLGY